MTRPHRLPPRSGDRMDATTFLTAVPALFGFVPTESLVLVVVGEGSVVHSVMRYDLSLTETGMPDTDLLGVLKMLGRIIARGWQPDSTDAVVGVIADSRYRPDDITYRRIFAIADRWCGGCGGLAQGFVVTAFEANAPWQLIWQPEALGPTTATMVDGSVGVLRDPHTCPTAIAAAVATGRRVLDDRAEMARMLEPLPHCADPDCAVERGGVAPGADLDRVGAGSVASSDGSVIDQAEAAALLTELLCAMQSPLSDLDCALTCRLERAILTVPVRDAVLACAVTDLRDGAHRLWQSLTRRLRGPGRACAATLLAHLHYIGGEGAYAGVALDCALGEAPDTNLAKLLDRALREGAQPALLWELIADSYRIASDLGVDLPHATLREVG